MPTTAETATTRRDASQRKRSGFKALRRWGTLSLGIALLIGICWQIQLHDLLAVLREIDPRFAAVALLSGLLATLLRATRYARFFPAPGRRCELYGAFALMRVLGHLFPLRSGEIVFLGVLSRRQLAPSIAEAAPVWLLLRVTDALALCFWLLLASLASSRAADMVGLGGYLFAPLLAITMLLPIGLARIARLLADGRYFAQDGWIGRRLQAISSGVLRLRTPGALISAVLWAIAVWGALITSMACAQLAFQTPLSWLSCCAAGAAMMALSLLPIHAPLTIGTGEATWVSVMVFAGVELNQALLIAVGIRLIMLSIMVIDILIGLTMFGVRSPTRTAVV